ncbi:hypothetical protein J6590_001070 [Homalodisca vitripennis]|nr:hypothetical protein J6590_001070 [Homalodisca vitripennis]
MAAPYIDHNRWLGFVMISTPRAWCRYSLAVAHLPFYRSLCRTRLISHTRLAAIDLSGRNKWASSLGLRPLLTLPNTCLIPVDAGGYKSLDAEGSLKEAETFQRQENSEICIFQMTYILEARNYYLMEEKAFACHTETKRRVVDVSNGERGSVVNVRAICACAVHCAPLCL